MGLHLSLRLIIVAPVMMLATCGSAPRQPDRLGARLAVVAALVRAERRAALERTNPRLREIAGIQGTEVAP